MDTALFPPPAQLLKQREGSLEELPLPLLLHALMLEERTCTLELKRRQLEKRITFEDGSPVACASNLLHETLGKFLVEKGRLSEADYQKALSESVQSGLQMGELLVKKGLIAPFDLYKQLQANLALKILDTFRWTDARFRLIADVEAPATSVRMNSAQLVLTGVSSFMPFDAVATHFTFTDERRFAQVPGAREAAEGLKLSAKDARLFQALRAEPTFAELLERTGLDTETVLRRLYALCILGVAGFADALPAPAPRAPAAAAEPPPPPSPAPAAAPAPGPRGVPFADEDEAVRNALMSAFLQHRSQDPFGLLEVPEDVQAVPLRRAFLALAERFSPLRFATAELREKAEALLAAYARAYGALSDVDQAALWRKRRAAAREKQAQAASRPSTAEQFRIRTDLLDGRTQFEEGRKRLEAGNFPGAFEYFEYACDIEPRSVHRAFRAWARYLLKPEAHGRLVLGELGELTREDPTCEDALFFLGEVARGESQWAQAEEAYRKAFKLNPKNRRYVELIQETGKRR
ncbi:DUF4388 domain-containing protein [Aggregicoccus sp. 17bor-14]|nr:MULTISPECIES: tetratricopeptide repeat protein [Myxococcaceae]MBF5045131.1 DUF4388 domain-containing protein [Simulacricoccus sp. 17bor-14]MRI90873.1 DUF4388 domain-containing protein [Aggregicoccus sp. 17bor-14]